MKDLVKVIGGRFSSALGIDLSSSDPREIFKWFLASILFGARIGVWEKADPFPSDLVIMAAKNLRLIPSDLHDRKEILVRLKKQWACEEFLQKDGLCEMPFTGRLQGRGKNIDARLDNPSAERAR